MDDLLRLHKGQLLGVSSGLFHGFLFTLPFGCGISNTSHLTLYIE